MIDFHSEVQKIAVQNSGRKLKYTPTEKIGVVEVNNFPSLGKIAALTFLEWVIQNPDGVISLPTGKTPEHFIKWVTHYLQNWDLPSVKADFEKNGLVPPKKRPDMSLLRFVQIDEFYPINPTQNNSFNHYIEKFYIRGFGLDRNNALLIDAWTTGIPKGKTTLDVFPEEVVDLSLRTRFGKTRQERLQKEVLERVDQYCTDYESQIRDMGGIGFFLGGIGPDGHIGFNVKGSDHYSTTRLTATNYETQASAAGDLGGIEVARNRLVITIGLSTITYNPKTVAIIIAAGEAKAKVVRDGIESNPSNNYPATVLQKLKHARFYLTKGAASQLIERKCQDYEQKTALSEQDVEQITFDMSLDNNKKLTELSASDFSSSRLGKIVLSKTKTKPDVIIKTVNQSLIDKINKGLAPVEDQVFMHTAPHHDDIMLGYWAYIIHLVRTPRNQHHFNYMTSGFNAVTNNYARTLLENLLALMDLPIFQQLLNANYFDPNDDAARNRDVYQYLDGVAAHSGSMQREGEARRILRNLIFMFEESSLTQLKNRVSELIMYFKTQYPGKKDLPYIQQFKGMIREWEADLLWGYLGFNNKNVNHMRLGFYKGDIFTEEPNFERDVTPVLNLLRKINPTVVTVALDPEGSGPDTHYKVLQVMAEALKKYEALTGRKDIQVWGYRNVWYRFHAADADMLVPVSLNSLAVLENAFEKSFGSQRDASFPSYELDGPFSRLARRIMVEQYQHIKTCLGREFFNESDHPRLRASHGMVYIKKMSLSEFYNTSIQLRKSTEDFK